MATKKKQIDAIALLKTDHKKVRALLETLDQTKAAPRRTKLLGQIEIEIKAHARIEEEIFYPAFKAKAEESDQLETYYEAQEEHGLVHIILPKTKASDPAGEEFGARAKVLKDLIVHHAKEEEKEMFKQARELFDRDELRSLGDQMERRRREVVRELKSSASS
ncbi:MAG TPA: hemerythrin domain-containing protein [Thermoanaerobaculia bacterium]|nr:hemerythrin domain-containing protein [Thermoanaerobaculia bacterium]